MESPGCDPGSALRSPCTPRHLPLHIRVKITLHAHKSTHAPSREPQTRQCCSSRTCKTRPGELLQQWSPSHLSTGPQATPSCPRGRGLECLRTNEEEAPVQPRPLHATPLTPIHFLLWVCTSTNGSFSFLTRPGKLTGWIRASINKQNARRDIHHPGLQGCSSRSWGWLRLGKAAVLGEGTPPFLIPAAPAQNACRDLGAAGTTPTPQRCRALPQCRPRVVGAFFATE